MNALILIDLQKDFLPGGALAVNEGDQVITVANKLLREPFNLKIASKDWHPANHSSFAVNQGKSVGETIVLDGLPQIMWPVHCVQDSSGADFADGLDVGLIDHVIYKGTDPNIDSYSAFFDNGHRRSTGLDDYLKSRGITDVYIAGLATDYCVLYTVMDALKLGFNTHVVIDACRGVNLHPDDSKNALTTMRNAGAHVVP